VRPAARSAALPEEKELLFLRKFRFDHFTKDVEQKLMPFLNAGGRTALHD
jgi:hypothetical protein